MNDTLAVFALILDEESFIAEFSLDHVFKEKVRVDIESNYTIRLAEELVSLGALVSLSSEHDVVEYLYFDHTEHGVIEPNDVSVSTDYHYFALGPQSASYIEDNHIELLKTAQTFGFKTAEKNLRGFGFSSAKWTGKKFGIETSEATLEHLQQVISLTKQKIEGLSKQNIEAAQAVGLIEAAERLLTTPEPPKEIIWIIIDRLAAITTISSTLVAILKKVFG